MQSERVSCIILYHMKRFIYCFVATLLIVSSSVADIGDIALKRGFGARATGMGGAYTAVADDGSATFYNPAGLADPGFAYTYGNPDSEHKTVDGTFQFLKLGYVGYASWNMKDSSNDEVSASCLGFGSRSGWLNWGINYKDLGWTVSGLDYHGWSSDIGFLARITPQFKIGLVAQDVLTSQATLVPASGRLGFGFKPFDGSLILAGDVEYQNTSQTYGHLGIEMNVAEGLALRVGLDRGETTSGLSLDFGAFEFDYAALFSQAGQTKQSFEMGFRILPRRERPFSIIKPKEFALIDVSGAIKGGRTEYSFLGGVHPGLDSILAQIRRAAKDKAIDGIMLKIGGFDGGLGGMAVVQEIRSELRRVRDKGKKIVAYLEGGAMGDEYYLVAMADKIIAPPSAAVGGFGKSVGILRIGGLYEKLGVEWQLLTQGKYKAAFNPYNLEMSNEQEAMIQGLVSELYRQMITDIASDRGMLIEEVKEIGDGMFYSAQEAKEMGLIDEVGYYMDAKKIAAVISGEKKEKEEARIIEPRLVEPDEFFLSNVFGVAVIEIDGEIVSGSGGENIIFGGRYVGPEKIVKYIKQASDDIFVKAIVLRINSPGGSAVAAGEIYKAIDYAKEKEKVVIASIGSIGASGGYYIAAAADKIVADPSSITGSIGVIGALPVYKQLLKKLEIKADVIKEGKHADMFSGLRKLTTEEISALEKIQAAAYDEFVQAVVAGRGLSTEAVKEAAQGRIYTGSQALDLKLIDKLGGFSDAIDLAKEEAKVAGEVRLIFYRDPSLFLQFGSEITESLGLMEWLLLTQEDI